MAILIWPWRRSLWSNPTTPKDSQPMISYRLVYHPKPVGPIISELSALLGFAILVSPWRRSPRSNLTEPEDSRPMISYRLVYHPKPVGPIISELYSTFKFGYPRLTLKEGSQVQIWPHQKIPSPWFAISWFQIPNL